MKKFLGIGLSLLLTVFSFVSGLGPGFIEVFAEGTSGTTKVIYLDSASGADTNDGTSKEKAVASLAKALELANDDDTIEIYELSPTNDMTVNKKVHLVIAKDLTLNGEGIDNGLSLSNGATLKCKDGVALNILNFGLNNPDNYINYSLKLSNGAKILDGNYQITGKNQGLMLIGESYVEGSSKDKLHLVSTGGYAPNFIQSVSGKTPSFKGATVEFSSNSTKRIGSGFGGLFGAWVDGTHGLLVATDSDITIKGIGGGLYLSPQLTNSSLTIDKAQKDIKTACNFVKDSKLENSTVTINTGWQAGISVSPNVNVQVINSTIVMNNGGDGGLNVAGGSINFTKSKLLAGENPPSSLFGTGIRGNDTSVLKFDSKSFVKTNKVLGGAINDGKPYIVMGGLFDFNSTSIFDSNGKVKNNSVNPLPVNDNNEALTLFELNGGHSDKSLDVGYSYEIPDISTENKYVWLPRVDVSFDLNNASIANAATFEDGSKENKIIPSIRNQAFNLAKSYNGVTKAGFPTPTAIGYKFLGWYDGDTKYEETSKIANNLTLVAKWEEDANSYGIEYLKNLGDETAVTVAGTSADRNESVLSFDEILAKSPKFAKEGYEFKEWNTKADGSGTAYKAGTALVVPKGERLVKLYAQYEPKYVKVKFDTNGGSFKEGTIFLNDKVFELSEDKKVATLKGEILQGTKLIDAIKALDSTVTSLPTELTSESEGLKDKFIAPNEYMEMKESSKQSFLWWSTTNYAWYSAKDAEKKEIAKIDGNTKLSDATFYLGWTLKPTVEKFNQNINIPGEIYINEGKSEPTLVNKGENFDLTAQLDITNVKAQTEKIEEVFGAVGNTGNIALKDLKTSFVGTLTVPDGVAIPSDLTKEKVSTKGFNDFYQIDDLKVEGQKIIVTMSVKAPENIDTYEKLKDGLLKSGIDIGEEVNKKSVLELTIKGFKVNDDAYGPNKKFNFDGSFDGDLKAFATKNNKAKYIELSWNTGDVHTAVITPKDFIKAETEVYGDILIGDNTEHEAYYKVKSGDQLTYTGRLFVAKVKEQITSIKNAYGKDTSNIRLKDVATSFTVKLKLGDGLQIEPDKLLVKLDDNPIYKIDDSPDNKVSYDEATKTITIPLVMKKAYNSFDDLYNDVLNLGGKQLYLDMKIGPVKVTATAGRQTVTGNVQGTFNAIAYLDDDVNKNKAYDFTWNAVQNLDNEAYIGDKDGKATFAPNGKDYLLKNDKDSKVISFTSEIYNGSYPEPSKPVKPVKPIEPIDPVNPTNPARPVSPTQPEIPVMPEKDKTSEVPNSPKSMGHQDVKERKQVQKSKSEVDTGDHSSVIYQVAALTLALGALCITIKKRIKAKR